MKNTSAILLFAFVFILFACKKEDEKSIISYETGREIAQSLSMMQLCIHEADRIIANEYDVCPLAVAIFPMPASNGTRYEATYGEGCTLPNGMEMNGTFKVSEFNNDAFTGLRRRLISINFFRADTLSISGILTMMEQSDSTWNVYYWSNLLYDRSIKIRLEGYPKAQMTEGLGTATTTDNQWTITVDSLLITRLSELETYAFTEPGKPLQSSGLCAWGTSGTLNINNGDAILQFGDGTCDNIFWLEWSSGASVQYFF